MNAYQRSSQPSLLPGLLLLAAAFLLAACAAAPSPTPTLLLSPSPEPAPTHTPTPAPTPTPAVRVITAASAPAAPTVGGRPWAARTWPASALAGLLAEAGAVGAVVADADGRVHAWTADGAWWLGEGPAGWTWDAAAQVWRREGAAFLPDVLLPGRWDAAAGRAVATAAAEMVWLWQDGDAAYRIAALYPAGTVRPADLAAPGGVAVALTDGRVLYLAGAGVEALAPGEALVRDEAGDLLKVLADGSRYRRVTAWGNVRSAGEMHQAGAFAGPLDMGPYRGSVDPFIPPIPYAPESMVPNDRQTEAYRYAFPDPTNLKAQLLDDKNRPIAQAIYNPQEGRWVWEKVERGLDLVQAELSYDEMKRFVVNPEDHADEIKRRLFYAQVAGGEKIKIFFSKKAFEQLRGHKIDGDWLKLLESGLGSNIGILTKPTRPSKALEQHVFVERPSLPVIFLWEGNKPYVLFLADDEVSVNHKTSGFLGSLDGSGGVSFQKIPFYGYDPKPIGQIWLAVERYDVRYLAKSDSMIADDGWQIGAYLVADPQGQYDWRPVPPGEHHYVIEDPQKQVEFVVKKLRTEKSSHSDIYNFDDYLVTEYREGLPQIVIVVTNGVPALTKDQKQMILDYLFWKGENKKRGIEKNDPKKEEEIRQLLTPLKNGFTPEQAKALKRWLDQWFNKLLSSSNPSDKEVLEIIRAADPRFIVINGLNMMTRFSGDYYPYMANPNDFNRSIWGIERAPYVDFSGAHLTIFHEIANIYLITGLTQWFVTRLGKHAKEGEGAARRAESPTANVL